MLLIVIMIRFDGVDGTGLMVSCYRRRRGMWGVSDGTVVPLV